MAMPYHEVNAARPYIRNDGSQLRCPRISTCNTDFAAGLAGWRLPSDCHGFQGKTRTDG
jgi:hypothetical protein